MNKWQCECSAGFCEFDSEDEANDANGGKFCGEFIGVTDARLTEQERAAIRALIRKGCDPVFVAWLFRLRDGELCEIAKEEV